MWDNDHARPTYTFDPYSLSWIHLPIVILYHYMLVDSQHQPILHNGSICYTLALAHFLSHSSVLHALICLPVPALPHSPSHPNACSRKYRSTLGIAMKIVMNDKQCSTHLYAHTARTHNHTLSSYSRMRTHRRGGHFPFINLVLAPADPDTEHRLPNRRRQHGESGEQNGPKQPTRWKRNIIWGAACSQSEKHLLSHCRFVFVVFVPFLLFLLLIWYFPSNRIPVHTYL